MAPKMEIKQTEEPKYLGDLINSLVLPDNPKIINQHHNDIIAGMGPHGKRVCHTFKLLKGGSFNDSSPQKSRRRKEQEAQ